MSFRKSYLDSVQMRCAFLAILLIFYGCSAGRPPTLTYQICMQSQNDLNEFRALLREEAINSGMKFFDRTDDSKREMEVISKESPRYNKDEFILNAGILSDDGTGLTASNIPGPGMQVVLGFSGGSNKDISSKFFEKMETIISKRWRMKRVDPNAGAVSDKDCL